MDMKSTKPCKKKPATNTNSKRLPSIRRSAAWNRPGLILSYWGDETTGARRRYYTITEEGSAQYQAAVAEWARTKDLIDKLIL